MINARAPLLRAAVGFAVPATERELRLLRTWLDSWSGIGRVAVGMAHQGFDLQLTRYDERGWRATFYVLALDVTETGDAAQPPGVRPEGWPSHRRM